MIGYVCAGEICLELTLWPFSVDQFINQHLKGHIVTYCWISFGLWMYVWGGKWGLECFMLLMKMGPYMLHVAYADCVILMCILGLFLWFTIPVIYITYMYFKVIRAILSIFFGTCLSYFDPLLLILQFVWHFVVLGVIHISLAFLWPF